MYHYLHTLQLELTLYHNDWGKMDMVRKWLVTVNGYALDLLR